MSSYHHVPVLQNEVLEALRPAKGETVIDCTLGLGGHASAFLERIGAEGHLYGLDADAENLAESRDALARFSDSLSLHHANFRDIASLDLPQADIIFADLGVSSPHFDDPKRGFSFRYDGPLDLRFDRTQGKTASDFLQKSSASDIAFVFKRYGELQGAKRLAEEIKTKGKEINDWGTQDLVQVAQDLFTWKAKDLLPQIFQALRMQMNDEVGALEVLLQAAPKMLKKNGRLGVISFHSLEDRLVKQAFKNLCEHEKDDVTGQVSRKADFVPLTKKAIDASMQEKTENPRSRSAKFRAIQKVS